MTDQKNITKIIQALGGSSIVGRTLGVAPQATSQWARRGVPLDRVLGLIRLGKERGVDITPQQLRPDLDWDALRKELK